MRTPLALALILTTSGLTFDRAADGEPPLRISIEIEGQELQLLDGERGALEIDGRRVAVRARVSPTRRFVGGGVSFEFPRAMSFEHEGDGAIDLWNLDGGDCVVHVQANSGGDPQELLGIYLAAARDAMHPEAEDPAAIEIDLGGTLHPGLRLEVELAGHRQHFSGVALQVGQRPVLLILQDSAPRLRRPSPEARKLLELLASTFRLEE